MKKKNRNALTGRHTKNRIPAHRRRYIRTLPARMKPEPVSIKTSPLPLFYSRQLRRSVTARHRTSYPAVRTERRKKYALQKKYGRKPQRFIIPVIDEIPEETIITPAAPRKKKSLLKYIALLTAAALLVWLAKPDTSVTAAEETYTYEEETDAEEIIEESEETVTKTEVFSLTQLQSMLEEELSAYSGDWSVYVKDLSTGEEFAVNDEKMHSASLIKLFDAERYEQMVSDGTLTADDYSAYYEEYMISYSDNDAWVALETIMGSGSYLNGALSLNDYLVQNNYTDTARSLDYDGNYTPEGGNNWTSVSDVGEVLNKIYNGTFVNEEASARILNYMFNQAYDYKIPQGLPEGTLCANKTGELDYTQNDAAIVYGPITDYILVVMSDNVYDGSAVDNIINISTIVYNYLEVES